MQQSEKELLEQKEELQWEQASKKLVDEEVYKNLQSEYTRNRQNQIKMAVKLVEKDKRELLGLEKDLQDKVIREVYGLENITELKAVYWDEFYKDGWDNDLYWNDDDDKTSRLEQEIKILRHRQEKKEIDDAIESFRNNNKVLFDLENSEERIREELKYISSELPVNERVMRAWKAAFGAISSSDALYAKIMQSQWQGWVFISNKVEDKDLWTPIADGVLSRLRVNKKI